MKVYELRTTQAPNKQNVIWKIKEQMFPFGRKSLHVDVLSQWADQGAADSELPLHTLLPSG